MYSRDELVNKFFKDVKSLEKEIEHRKIYNIRNFFVKLLLKSGIAVDYALPYILSSIILFHLYSVKGDIPFHIDEITEKANIETIDTSSGIHKRNISYDFSYDSELIKYSTGWIINDKGLYERTETSYRISDEVNISDTDKVLSMSKEEIENILVVTNVQTICKSALTPEDEIYDRNAIIVVNHGESEDETITRQELSSENVGNSIWFILFVLVLGCIFEGNEKLFVKTYIRDRLRKYEPLYRQVKKEELESMKRILEVKKQNLDMINNTLEGKEYYKIKKAKLNEEHQYVLRKGK